jgi:DNA-binding NtrC family response regulator
MGRLPRGEDRPRSEAGDGSERRTGERRWQDRRAEDREHEGSVSASPAWSERGARRVLVVDDEQPVRRLIARILEAEGFEVLTAGSGRHGMHCLLEYATTLSLVVTDLVMPEISGYDLAEFARRHWPRLPFLFISGFPGEIRRVESLRTRGPFRFLEKPFGPAELLAKVHETLD